MNFILPERFADSLDSLRAIFKVKGDQKVSLLAQERVSRAKKMMTPFVLRRRKDQVCGTRGSTGTAHRLRRFSPIFQRNLSVSSGAR